MSGDRMLKMSAILLPEIVPIPSQFYLSGFAVPTAYWQQPSRGFTDKMPGPLFPIPTETNRDG
jgi:hypothetical protein